MQALRKSWFKADTLLSTKRPLPDQAEDAVSHAVMISRVLESNYLKAEALLQSTESKPDLIQLIRTKISRGQMEEAHALVIKALEITQEDSSFKNDLQLELCRVFYRTGEWTQSIEVANVLLNRDTLPSVGRLAALQTRSLCWFELGNWDRALRDIEDSRSLKMLYEQSQCCLYTEVLKIKTLARKNGVEGTLPLLSELWKKTANGEIPGNADTLLTLLRLEIDLKRIDNKDFSQEALACFHTAHAMGDDLYEALSILDLAYSTPSPLQRESRKRLFSLREKFRKIDSLLLEIEAEDFSSETARSIYKGIRLESTSDQPRAETFSLDTPLNTIVIFQRGQSPGVNFSLNLSDLKFKNINPQQRTQDLIFLLSEGPCEKPDFFKRGWHLKYNSEIHDNVIRTAISRIRKQTGLKVQSAQMVLSMPKALILK